MSDISTTDTDTLDSLESFDRSNGIAWLVPSKTEEGVEYRVFLIKENNWICTCADFWFRDKPCKHIEQVVASEGVVWTDWVSED